MVMKNRVYFASRRAFNLYSAIKDFYGGCISSTKKFLSDKNGAASCYSRQKMARFLPQKPALPSLPSLGKGPLSSGRGLASCLQVDEKKGVGVVAPRRGGSGENRKKRKERRKSEKEERGGGKSRKEKPKPKPHQLKKLSQSS